MAEERRIGFEIKKTSNMLGRCIENKITSISGIESTTRMQNWILGFLIRNNKKDIYQRDIEVECNIRRATVTTIIKLMEKNGLIERKSVESDARLKKIIVTKKGRCIHDAIFEEITEIENNVVEGISKEEIEKFYSVLDKIKSNLALMEENYKIEEKDLKL